MNQGRFVVALVAATLGWVGTAHGAVGRTPGDAGVSASGTAQYSVALTLPPGRRGLTPQLGLAYDSSRGRGLAGLGWSVTGASTIYRCEKTVAQDGEARGVRNVTDDGYCLDGNRLRLVGGIYGTAGSEYRTEIQTYSRLVAVGTAGNGPQSFKVDGRDGLRYYYGYTSDSRIESVGQSTVRAWALSRVEDRQGNFISFVWGEDNVNGGFRLEAVNYTGQGSVNGANGSEGSYAVDFQYVARTDVHVAYIGGSKVQQIHHLDAINVSYDGSTVRRYNFEYDVAPATARERLISVEECGAGALDCFSPTTFAYQAGSIGLGAAQNSGITLPSGATAIDVNGDGRDDLLYSSTNTSGTGKWMVAFANGAGGYGVPVNTNITNTNFTGAVYLDYNLDGKGDLLVPYSGTTWWILLGTATGLATPVNTGLPTTATGTGANAAAIDVNADGRTDLVWADIVGYAGGDAIRYRAGLATGGFSATASTLVGPYPFNETIQGVSWGSYRKPVDLNGDGRADFAVRSIERNSNSLMAPEAGVPAEEGSSTAPPADGQSAPAVVYSYTYMMDGYCPGIGWCWSGPTSSSATFAPVFGDFNGDGKSDALYRDAGGYFKYIYSKGVGTTGPLTGPSITGFGAWQVADWDGDGFEDAIAVKSTTASWHLMRSNGLSFDSPTDTGIQYGTTATSIQVMDVNGDALDDLGYKNSAGGWSYYLHSLNTALPDLLASAQDGYGTSATFTYLPITNATVYTKGTGTPSTMIDVNAGRWLVSQLARTDGSGGTSQATVTYSYEGARKDAQGRGWLGFAKRTSIDNALGHNLKTMEIYRQDFPYIGALLSSERQQSNGTRISFTSNAWANLLNGSGYAAYRYPYVSSSTTDIHEIVSPYAGTKVRSVTTALAAQPNGLDTTSGLVKDVTTTTTEVATGLNPASSKTERTNHTSVLNDTVNWCIGRPEATQQSNAHSLTFGSAITRATAVTWDGANCRPTQLQVEPGSATMQVTVTLSYDTYGNVSSQSVTGINLPARTTTTHWGSSGRFPESVTNALNQTTQQAWNYALGVRSAVTDANGLTASWNYDDFGRRTRETRPDGTSTWWTYSACSGSCDSRIKLQLLRVEKDAASQVIRADTDYIDRWDRLIWQKTQLLTGNDATWSIRRQFDARGALILDYAPYLATGTDNGYRQIAYDAIGRPSIEALYRAGGAIDRATNYAYAGLAITQTDPLNHATTRTMSAWGPLVRVTDAANGQMNYQYDAFGLLKQATDPSNNVVTQVTYNSQGMRTQLVDMDLGTWNYTPNALGEVVSQTDAKNQTTTFSYDALGRPYQRVEAEGTSTWTWGALSDNTAANKYVGRLKTVTGPGYGESFVYDGLARPKTRTIVSDQTYQFDYTYNALLGQLETLTYPTSTAGVRFKAKLGYLAGYLASVQDYTGNVNGSVLWNLNLLDARMNATSETYGNGLWLQNGYDALTGVPTTRKSGTGGQSSNVQNLSYGWDTSGNLSNRQDLRQSISETFTYDALDRLTLASGPASQSTAIGYSAIGNLTSKTGVGSYTYHATKKHAVVNAGGTGYGYDGNGNLISRGGATVSWSSFNYPTYLADPNGYSAQFSYAPDRSRWRQVSSYSGATETTIYVGGLLEKFTNAVTTHWKHIVPTPSGEVQVIRRTNGTSETLYVTTDPLGSTDAVLNAAGTVVMRASFAAYGERRASHWQGAPSAGEWQAIANTTRRGYTGHEAIDNVMLVHMNGRVFDPRIGRFTSADPFIDGSASTQGWNRYGYVHGRVMSATDPSGFILQWGSNDIKPLDHSNSPNVTLPAGGENVIVTASRIPHALSALARVAIQMNMMQASSRSTGGNFDSKGRSSRGSKEPDDKCNDTGGGTAGVNRDRTAAPLALIRASWRVDLRWILAWLLEAQCARSRRCSDSATWRFPVITDSAYALESTLGRRHRPVPEVDVQPMRDSHFNESAKRSTLRVAGTRARPWHGPAACCGFLALLELGGSSSP